MSSVLPGRADLLRMNPVEGAHRVALRAGVSVALPLAVVIALGHPEWAPYASFGAFASLYGRGEEHLVRAQMQVSAGIVMVMAVVSGVLVSMLPSSSWLLVLAAAVIGATGEIFAKAHSYHPPGPLFMIFAFGTIVSIPHTPRDVLTALLVSGLAAAFSVLVGVIGVLRDPRGWRRALREAKPLKLVFTRSRKPLWIALAVLLSGSISVLLGIGHPYWAMVAAVAPMSAPHVTQQVVRGVHRVIGTAAGLLTSWALLALHLDRPWAVAVIAVLQFAAEMLVGRNYGVAMLAITPLALMMGQLATPRPISQVLFDRGVETAIGACVGIAMVLVGHGLRERRKAKVADRLRELEQSRGRCVDPTDGQADGAV
ncbi:FUSC family protein [Luteococcus sp. Sow4_B9]|uniref:FUSC family protein n=1 Tax=Luteococcus sp. Sow4_B9 TaxID=3438792 RepID=UPI003F9728A5